MFFLFVYSAKILVEKYITSTFLLEIVFGIILVMNIFARW